MRGSIVPVPRGGSEALSPVTSGIIFESMASGSITHGTRGQGGQRYLSNTYRVRNATGGPLANVTITPISNGGTIFGTPFSSVQLFSGAAASAAIAPPHGFRQKA